MLDTIALLLLPYHYCLRSSIVWIDVDNEGRGERKRQTIDWHSFLLIFCVGSIVWNFGSNSMVWHESFSTASRVGVAATMEGWMGAKKCAIWEHGERHGLMFVQRILCCVLCCDVMWRGPRCNDVIGSKRRKERIEATAGRSQFLWLADNRRWIAKWLSWRTTDRENSGSYWPFFLPLPPRKRTSFHFSDVLL